MKIAKLNVSKQPAKGSVTFLRPTQKSLKRGVFLTKGSKSMMDKRVVVGPFLRDWEAVGSIIADDFYPTI